MRTQTPGWGRRRRRRAGRLWQRFRRRNGSGG